MSPARPEILLRPDEIAGIAQRLAESISLDHPDGVILVGTVAGSVIFLADLARHVRCPCALDFLALSSYATGGGPVRILRDLDLDVAGRDVILVTEIVDTGLTTDYVLRQLIARGPSTVEVCALFDRPARRILPISLRYVGRELGDEYVVGYGIGFAGRYRNLAAVLAVDREALETDPDVYVSAAFGG